MKQSSWFLILFYIKQERRRASDGGRSTATAALGECARGDGERATKAAQGRQLRSERRRAQSSMRRAHPPPAAASYI